MHGKHFCDFGSIPVISMKRKLLPHVLILYTLFVSDTACCNFAAAVKNALFNRTLITHTFNLTMARVN